MTDAEIPIARTPDFFRTAKALGDCIKDKAAHGANDTTDGHNAASGHEAHQYGTTATGSMQGRKS